MAPSCKISDPLTTWYKRMSLRVSGSARSSFILSCPNKAKAASVGAKTVNVDSGSSNTVSKPVACSAVTKVVKLPLLTATSTIDAGGVGNSTSATTTVSIT